MTEKRNETLETGERIVRFEQNSGIRTTISMNLFAIQSPLTGKYNIAAQSSVCDTEGHCGKSPDPTGLLPRLKSLLNGDKDFKLTREEAIEKLEAFQKQFPSSLNESAPPRRILSV